MSKEVTYITGSAANGGGYVKGDVDNGRFEVKPIMSTISSIIMLNSFNGKDIGDLEEKMVSIGDKEEYIYLYI